MLMGTFGLLLAAFAAADDAPQWLTVSPSPSSDRATVILPPTTVQPGHSYLLTWQMRVEGEKPWRFRADFAGVTVRFTGADEYTPTSVEKQTSCSQTLDWQSAWLVVDPSPGTHAIDATMAIVSKEQLPGRFRIRDVRLIDLNDPLPLRSNEAELRVTVVDDNGKDTPARVYIVDETGQGITPPHTYAYTQGTRCFELIDPRLARLALPAGRYTVRAMKGFEYAIASETITIQVGQRHTITLAMRRQIAGFVDRFRTIDHHTHLYRHGGSLYPMMDLNDVLRIAQAEGLDYVPFQGVDKAMEHCGGLIGASCAVDYTQELTRDFWGHICPIYNQSIVRPVSVDGVNHSAEELGSAAPMNMDYVAAIRADGFGAVAYAHPYGPLRMGSEVAALEDPKAGLIAREWPIDLALGVRCPIDMLAKEDARGEFALKLRDYMRLLNLGFRCGVTGSTDFHLDQGREPIGGLRTYAHSAGNDWVSIGMAYNNGLTYATNGPLVDLSLGVCTPGMMLVLDRPGLVRGVLEARSLWGLTRAQLWMNGEMVLELHANDGSISPTGSDNASRSNFAIPVEHSGWLLAIVEGPAVPDVMTSPEGKPCVAGQYAITSPIYIEVLDRPAPANAEAARYFVAWCDAVRRGFDTLCKQQAAEGRPVPEAMRKAIHDRVENARTVLMNKMTKRDTG